MTAALAAVGHAWGSFTHWQKDPKWREAYELARIAQAEMYADRAESVLAEGLTAVAKGEPKVANATAALYRELSGVARWRAGVGDRRRYGERETAVGVVMPVVVALPELRPLVPPGSAPPESASELADGQAIAPPADSLTDGADSEPDRQ